MKRFDCLGDISAISLCLGKTSGDFSVSFMRGATMFPFGLEPTILRIDLLSMLAETFPY